jgi:hypothetical protein
MTQPLTRFANRCVFKKVKEYTEAQVASAGAAG